MSYKNKFKLEFNYSDQQLEKLYTKQLLKIKNGAIYMLSRDSGTIDEFNDKSRDELSAYIDKIKVILSTREHIPSKPEAKAIRQAKAKAKRNQ